jgi:curli biogenesis system outer membrane secretion channel CsgG
MNRSVVTLAVILTGCGPIGEMIQNAGQPTTNTVSATGQSIDQVQLEPYNGPKARVAVYQFGDRTGKGKGIVRGYPGYGWYSAQIGDGMADMLTDALMLSNRFIVLDRQAIKDVEYEQDLASRGRVNQETATPTGQIEGADLLIKGSVTEFEPGSAGAGGGLGLGCFYWWQCAISIGTEVIGRVQQSHVAMIVQVVDARTSRILFSTTVEGKANDFNLAGSLGAFGAGYGGVASLGTWQKTPVEKAIRIAILQAVKELSSKTPQTYFRHGAEDRAANPHGSSTQPLISSAHQIRNEPLSASSSRAISSVLPATLRVKPNTANLRDVPGTQGKVLATLRAGTKLSVQGEEKGWYFVQAENGKDGWIAKSLTREASGSDY